MEVGLRAGYQGPSAPSVVPLLQDGARHDEAIVATTGSSSGYHEGFHGFFQSTGHGGVHVEL